MLLNLAFALSLIGWFGVNLNLFGDSIQRLLQGQFHYQGPEWPWELTAGVLITGTTLVGLKAINRLSMLIVPVLLLVCALLLAISWRADGSVSDILAHAPATGISFGDAVSAIVGGYIVGAVIMPDTCRFIGPAHGAVWTATTTYFVSSAGIMIIGGLAWRSHCIGPRCSTSCSQWAWGLGGFAIVIGGSWLLNALNLYSAGLSVDAALPRLSRSTTTLLCGALGTLTVFLNILDHFLTFLFYLSIVFVPVASIIVIDFFWLRRSDYLVGDGASRGIEPPALAAWAVGAGNGPVGVGGAFTPHWRPGDRRAPRHRGVVCSFAKAHAQLSEDYFERRCLRSLGSRRLGGDSRLLRMRWSVGRCASNGGFCMRARRSSGYARVRGVARMRLLGSPPDDPDRARLDPAL